jgi:hypothetical protein
MNLEFRDPLFDNVQNKKVEMHIKILRQPKKFKRLTAISNKFCIIYVYFSYYPFKTGVHFIF